MFHCTQKLQAVFVPMLVPYRSDHDPYLTWPQPNQSPRELLHCIRRQQFKDPEASGFASNSSDSSKDDAGSVFVIGHVQQVVICSGSCGGTENQSFYVTLRSICSDHSGAIHYSALLPIRIYIGSVATQPLQRSFVSICRIYRSRGGSLQCPRASVCVRPRSLPMRR